MKAQKVFDLVYALHVLAAAVFVKANGEIMTLLENNQNWNGRSYAFFGVSSVLTVFILLGVALLYWRKKDLPVLAIMFVCCIAIGGVTLSTGYLLLSLLFAVGWYFFNRKPPIFGSSA